MGWERIKNFFVREKSMPVNVAVEPPTISSPITIPQHIDASVRELWGRALSNPVKGEGTILLKMEESLFRYVPLSIVETAKNMLSETGDSERVARYIENAFYIYRATVCAGWVAVLYKTDDAYEWPSPSKFSWSSIDAVLFGGEHIHGKIPEDDSKVVISIPTSDCRVEKTEIEFGARGEVLRNSTTVEDIIPSKNVEVLHKTFKYRVPNIELVGFIGHQHWQTASLRAFANPLYAIISDSVKCVISKEDSRRLVEKHLEDLSKSYPCSIARYIRKGEKPDSGVGMMFMG